MEWWQKLLAAWALINVSVVAVLVVRAYVPARWPWQGR